MKEERDVYNIQHWGDGYFDSNASGEITVGPKYFSHPGVSLPTLVKDIQKQGLRLPILLRFNDLLTGRVRALHEAFAGAMRYHNYQSSYTSIYPIKVNQQRKVVEQILEADSQGVGLEAGSKPELMATLAALSGRESLIICNGYKDREYIRYALIGRKMGHRVYIIIEKISELAAILEEAAALQIEPLLGVRVRLSSIAAGKWQNTGGEKAKFGVTSAQLLQIVDELTRHQKLQCLQLLHFHMGSQIANIHHIQRALQEATRFYVELHRLGARIHYVDVGGGLGIDYEGTRSRSDCSMNYSLEEYANKVVGAFADICLATNLPRPHLLTESGRAMTAHHAVLIINSIDIEKVNTEENLLPASSREPQVIQELWSAFENDRAKSSVELYHDVCHAVSEAHVLFTHGLLTLTERARAEQIYIAVCTKIQKNLNPSIPTQREIYNELNEKLADRIFGNFSLFRSIPDVWALEQIFPVVPIKGLNDPLVTRCVVADLTCDSDGRIDHYVDGEGIETTLPLPATQNGYILGIFLVGAYQEILGDIHNLFGNTDSVHVKFTHNGGYELLDAQAGNSIAEILSAVRFSAEDMLVSYQKQLKAASVSPEEQTRFIQILEAGLRGYTYLEEA